MGCLLDLICCRRRRGYQEINGDVDIYEADRQSEYHTENLGCKRHELNSGESTHAQRGHGYKSITHRERGYINGIEHHYRRRYQNHEHYEGEYTTQHDTQYYQHQQDVSDLVQIVTNSCMQVPGQKPSAPYESLPSEHYLEHVLDFKEEIQEQKEAILDLQQTDREHSDEQVTGSKQCEEIRGGDCVIWLKDGIERHGVVTLVLETDDCEIDNKVASVYTGNTGDYFMVPLVFLQKETSEYRMLVELEELMIIENSEASHCQICMTVVKKRQGVQLRECLHIFHRECLIQHVKHCEEPQVKCPYVDELNNNSSCSFHMQHQEIKALVPEDIFEKFVKRSLMIAESQADNAFHCKNVDCPGWCLCEEKTGFIECPVCGKINCLQCQGIHTGMTCGEYRRFLKRKRSKNQAAESDIRKLQELIQTGEVMHCPQCRTLISKPDGCDWLQCVRCKTEICWATKGPRWGPMGRGDTSGGCGCDYQNKKCHPDCAYCH